MRATDLVIIFDMNEVKNNVSRPVILYNFSRAEEEEGRKIFEQVPNDKTFVIYIPSLPGTFFLDWQ